MLESTETKSVNIASTKKKKGRKKENGTLKGEEHGRNVDGTKRINRFRPAYDYFR